MSSRLGLLSWLLGHHESSMNGATVSIWGKPEYAVGEYCIFLQRSWFCGKQFVLCYRHMRPVKSKLVWQLNWLQPPRTYRYTRQLICGSEKRRQHISELSSPVGFGILDILRCRITRFSTWNLSQFDGPPISVAISAG